MKIKSIAASLSLGVFSSLLAVTLSPPLEINRQRVSAQEATSLCPLPDNIAITFQGAKCKKVTLQMPQTFFRLKNTGDTSLFCSRSSRKIPLIMESSNSLRLGWWKLINIDQSQKDLRSKE